MWFYTPTALLRHILAMHIGMSHFMYVGNQKGVQIEVTVYGNLQVPIGPHPEVAQAGSAWPCGPKLECVGLVQLLTIGNSCCRNVFSECAYQQTKTKKAL